MSQTYHEPSFDEILARVEASGIRLDVDVLRRYHLALKLRRLVILCGPSGTGKTWLTEVYANAVRAEYLLVPVAPNWTTNEDLLGYFNPVDGEYHDTEFTRFLRRAAQEYDQAKREGRVATPYHLVLDEMNLARVEYYFAKFLSVMETRARKEVASIELAAHETALLTPNLAFVGTVNIDETTHGFADKVYDRSQLIELGISREALAAHVGDMPCADLLLDVCGALASAAPVGFRVIDEIKAYIVEAIKLGIPPEVALDEQILQKVLPKCRGTHADIPDALERLDKLLTARCLRSRGKVQQMREGHSRHGFASYF